MKILLLNPPYLESVYSGFKPAVQVQLPLGLAYIASVLEQSGQDVSILDANAEELNINETIEKVTQSDCEIVGITAATALIPTVKQIARGIKQRTCKKIILGGPHVTFLPEMAFTEIEDMDIAVLGEGEETIKELFSRRFAELDSIGGIAFRNHNSIVVNERRARIGNLDALPFPARHMFKPELYRPGALWNIGVSDKESAAIITSRGCPSRCTYCSSLSFWGPQVRFRSIGNIIQEIKSLKEDYGVKQLAIVDDTFLADKNRAESFCDEIVNNKIKINWWCYARLDSFYPRELFKKMRRAGCYGLSFGVESGNQEVLDAVRKNINLNTAEKIISLAKREGFLVLASFMVGLPKDTRNTVRQTIDFSIRLNPHIAHYCITTPFPGTELYNEAQQKGWLLEAKSWSDIGLHQKSKFRNDSLTSEEIYDFYRMANKKFYFRLSYFWLIFKRLLRNPREFRGFILAGVYMIRENFVRNGNLKITKY